MYALPIISDNTDHTGERCEVPLLVLFVGTLGPDLSCRRFASYGRHYDRQLTITRIELEQGRCAGVKSTVKRPLAAV
jgi:hypothetical protein